MAFTKSVCEICGKEMESGIHKSYGSGHYPDHDDVLILFRNGLLKDNVKAIMEDIIMDGNNVPAIEYIQWRLDIVNAHWPKDWSEEVRLEVNRRVAKTIKADIESNFLSEKLSEEYEDRIVKLYQKGGYRLLKILEQHSSGFRYCTNGLKYMIKNYNLRHGTHIK